MWLGYRQLTLPNATRELLRRETDALIRDVVFDNPRSYLDLFLADGSFMNRELAEHYNSLIVSEGMSEEGLVPVPDGDELEWVPYGSSGRLGTLGQGSFLASFGKFEFTSPTQRGRTLTPNAAAALTNWQGAFEANDYDLRATLIALRRRSPARSSTVSFLG